MGLYVPRRVKSGFSAVWGFGWVRRRAKGNDSVRMAQQRSLELERCRDWRQGDVFRGARTFVFDGAWKPSPIETTYGAVVVSQSCDASLPSRARIQIAPLVRLEDPHDANEAAAGKRPQFVAVPQLGSDFFADLDGIITVSKAALLSCERVAGVQTDKQIREFAFSVARRFGRFAYPDEVVECLSPLTKAIRSKAHKEQSPIGKALTRVHSFRVHCEDWTTAPYELTLVVIMEPDVVPSDLDGINDPPDTIDAPSDDKLNDQITAYAVYLDAMDRSPAERYYAWQYLAEAWARQCQQTAISNGLTAHVASVTAELDAVDSFPLSRYLITESLDLDYLSDSRKPIT